MKDSDSSSRLGSSTLEEMLMCGKMFQEKIHGSLIAPNNKIRPYNSS